jgi:hypothetical protein
VGRDVGKPGDEQQPDDRSVVPNGFQRSTHLWACLRWSHETCHDKMTNLAGSPATPCPPEVGGRRRYAGLHQVYASLSAAGSRS